MILQSSLCFSILRPEGDFISSNGHIFKKPATFDDNRHFIFKEKIVTYEDFDCSITFTLKLLKRSDWSIENGNTIPDLAKKPSAFPATMNISVVLTSSMALISFWTHTIFETWVQQLLFHSTTLIIHTLCPVSIFNQQLTNLEQTQIRFSFHCERWTVKGRDCASALLSFKEITYRMDEWTKQLLRLKSWVLSGNPEQWMDLRRLWWTVFVC